MYPDTEPGITWQGVNFQIGGELFEINLELKWKQPATKGSSANNFIMLNRFWSLSKNPFTSPILPILMGNVRLCMECQPQVLRRYFGEVSTFLEIWFFNVSWTVNISDPYKKYYFLKELDDVFQMDRNKLL